MLVAKAYSEIFVKNSVNKTTKPDYASFITYRISQLNSKMNAQGARLLGEEFGLSVVRWRLLALVAGSQPVTSSTLVKSIDMDAGQFSRNLKAMIEEGLINSRVDEIDNRQHTLTLSRQGRALFNKTEPVMKHRRESLMDGVSSSDADAFFRTLEQIEMNLKTELLEKSHA